MAYRAEPDVPRPSGWATGGITFAASMLVLVGIFQMLEGVVAIADDSFYVVTRNYTYDLDVTAWGWVHLVLGIFVFVTGLALFSRRPWAVVAGLIFAILSAIDNFFFIPYYPWWSLLVIALDAWVIWALTRPGAAVRT